MKNLFILAVIYSVSLFIIYPYSNTTKLHHDFKYRDTPAKDLKKIQLKNGLIISVPKNLNIPDSHNVSNIVYNLVKCDWLGFCIWNGRRFVRNSDGTFWEIYTDHRSIGNAFDKNGHFIYKFDIIY